MPKNGIEGGLQDRATKHLTPKNCSKIDFYGVTKRQEINITVKIITRSWYRLDPRRSDASHTRKKRPSQAVFLLSKTERLNA